MSDPTRTATRMCTGLAMLAVPLGAVSTTIGGPNGAAGLAGATALAGMALTAALALARPEVVAADVEPAADLRAVA